MSVPRDRLLGAILAGGRSRRFGSDKAAARLGERSLIEHAIAALSAHVAVVAICGRTVPGLLSLADRPAAGLGPLGGLNAALHHARAHGFQGVLATACDMPFFPAPLATALVSDGPAVLRGQQLAGYWPADLAPALDAYLAASEDRSVAGWMRTLAVRLVPLPPATMPNINTRDDLAALVQSQQ